MLIEIFKDINWHKYGWLTIGILSLFAILGLIAFGEKPTFALLEYSWELVLHYAFETNKDLGKDIIFTFGPYGFLYFRHYYPSTYPFTLIAWLWFSIVFWWISLSISYRLIKNPLISIIWLASLIFLVINDRLHDTLFITFNIFICIYYFYIDEEKISKNLIILTLTLALISLIKFSFFVITVSVIFVIGLSEILKKKKPLLLTIFISTASILWLLSGQSILSFPNFIISSLEISNGYETMAYKPVNTVIIPLVLTITFFLLVVFFELRKRKKQWLLVISALLSIVLFSFKAGYCRADGFHTSIFVKLIFVLTLFYTIVAFQSKEHRYLKILFVLCLIQATFSLNLHILSNKSITLVSDIKNTCLQIESNYISFFNIVNGKASLKDSYEKEQEKIRKKYSLPNLKGAVDIYAFHQQIAFAYKLDYQPRPVFQSYSAYTEKLSKINAEYLKGSRAPENILFRIETIDNRYPSLEDSLSWPELLTNYDIKEILARDSFMLMQKSNSSRNCSFTPQKDVLTKFNQPIEVASINNTRVWIKIKINRNTLGIITSKFYQPPKITLRVSTIAGITSDYNIPILMAETGFLLSPIVTDTLDFALLASSNWQEYLDLSKVKTITVLVSEEDKRLVKEEIKVSFSELNFDSQETPQILKGEFLSKYLEGVLVKGSSNDIFYINQGKLKKTTRKFDLANQTDLEETKVISDKLLELIPREGIEDTN
ncbi:MAG: hypothetical protein HY819_07500 [Acidobacteria bacterium]|nr:hypothetical protein [Acidobacteriota bacterium]